MASAVLRKSVTDLTRRKARAAFAVLTLAIAVASVGIFAAPALMDRAMQAEVQANRLPDLTLSMEPLDLSSGQLAALRRLPNVEAVDGRSVFQTRVWIGARRVKAVVVGVPDFSRQPVDVVSVVSGDAAGPGSVLSDVQNGKRGTFTGGIGDSIRILGAGGGVVTAQVSGLARNLTGGQLVSDGSFVVLYTTPALISRLGADAGFTSLELRLRDASTAAANRTAEAVRSYLRANTGFTSFTNMPSIRKAGSYPGKQFFDQLAQLMDMFTVLALLAAVVLVANTMTTLIGEQRREIGMMKAIGGTRRQIRRIFLRTAVLLGAAGSLLGVVLGLVIANAIVRYFGSNFFAINPGFAVSIPVVVAGVLVGLIAPPLAALPAIRRGSRISVREGLEEVPALQGGQALVDRALRRFSFLPRTAQIGLRSITRRARRSLTTVVQIGLAVGTLIAVLALVDSVTSTTNAVWNQARFDLVVNTAVGKQFDAAAGRLIRGTPGVARAEPSLSNSVTYDGKDAFVTAFPGEPMFVAPITDGRWYSAAEGRTGARVAVISKNLARTTGTHVGERVTLETSAGPASFRVVGVTSSQWNNGLGFYVPLKTVQMILHSSSVNSYFIRTRSADHAAIDRTTTRVEDALAAAGYSVGTDVKYADQRANVSQNRQLSSAIGVLGLLIVAISMVGLINAVTMSVLERTREIGVLRCIGASARDIRRIFMAEGLAVSLGGWLLGIPIGYGIARGFNWLLLKVIGLEFGFTFPPLNLLIALVGTVVLALLIMRLPLRRAVRFKPGDALRYA